MVFVHFFKLSAKKPMQIRPLLMKTIKEIHNLTIGGVPGVSIFKSRASPPLFRIHIKTHSIFFSSNLKAHQSAVEII